MAFNISEEIQNIHGIPEPQARLHHKADFSGQANPLLGGEGR